MIMDGIFSHPKKRLWIFKPVLFVSYRFVFFLLCSRPFGDHKTIAFKWNRNDQGYHSIDLVCRRILREIRVLFLVLMQWMKSFQLFHRRTDTGRIISTKLFVYNELNVKYRDRKISLYLIWKREKKNAKYRVWKWQACWLSQRSITCKDYYVECHKT